MKSCWYPLGCFYPLEVSFGVDTRPVYIAQNKMKHSNNLAQNSFAVSELKVLVIGFGNPLRGDDGMGWHAAGLLAQEIPHQAVRVMQCHQLTPELAEPISRASRVIFIDVCATNAPGTFSCEHVEPSLETSSSFSHDFGPPALLLLAKWMYGRAPEAMLLTVAGESFDHQESLSPIVLNQLPALLQRARELMAL